MSASLGTMTESTTETASYDWQDIHGPIHVTEFGGNPNRPHMVLVHGLGGSHANWALLAPHLSDVGYVTAIDLPGFGKSEPGTRRATVEENTAALIRFLEEFDEPAILIGNSMGGMLSILTAAQRPELVSRLVLLGPALPIAKLPVTKPAVLWADAFLTGWGLLASPLVRRMDLRTRVRIMLNVCGVNPDDLPASHIDRAVTLISEREDIQGMDRALVVAARSLVRILGDPTTYRAAMASVSCPVLLLQGEKDRLVDVANARDAIRRNPHWRYHEYRDSGHVLQLEHPQAVAFDICHWLEELA